MIDFIFVILNFAVIVGLAYYGAQRVLVPFLKNKLDADIKTEQNLHNEHHNLLVTHKQVDESIVTQEADCASFLDKINQWRSVVAEQKDQREIEKRAMHEEAEKRLHLQSEYHMLKTMYKDITPFVVKKLEDDLKNHFADERTAHSYLQHVLKTLKK